MVDLVFFFFCVTQDRINPFVAKNLAFNLHWLAVHMFN